MPREFLLMERSNCSLSQRTPSRIETDSVSIVNSTDCFALSILFFIAQDCATVTRLSNTSCLWSHGLTLWGREIREACLITTFILIYKCKGFDKML